MKPAMFTPDLSDKVPLGGHLIHFWHTDAERGVRFL